MQVERSPIQQHTSAIVRGLIGQSDALKNLDQRMLKGRLRELFISEFLSKFLTDQFGIGTGSIIINQNGEQSGEVDIIIYDKRILPPFIQAQEIGIYPAECVLAVIEIRSWIDRKIIKCYSEKATEFFEEIYNPASSLYRDYDHPNMRPYYSLLGFYDKGTFKKDASREEILQWMMNNAKPLFGVCLVNRFSWLNVMRPQGSLKKVDVNNEETKAFIAVLLDNVRTLSQRRYLPLVTHNDWLSIYTRDQSGIARGPSGIRIKRRIR